MADLVAQGNEPHFRWRRTLPPDQPLVLGRGDTAWSVPWDRHISRWHCRICWQDGQLAVERLPTARNPVFVQGKETDNFLIRPGEHFVIGQTAFWVTDEQVSVSLNMPAPLREQSYSPAELQKIRYRNADQRIEVLSRVPEVISSAVSDSELFVRLVNMLLMGIPKAGAVAIVECEQDHENTHAVRLLHWDRRTQASGQFSPSERLIEEAVQRLHSVLHVWDPGSSSAFEQFTVCESYDWAFCTPVPGDACTGWALYVAGRFDGDPNRPDGNSEATDLREDLKFTELVASILSSLRQVQVLRRTQATFSQFFAPAVLESLGRGDPEKALSPRETDVCVLFCDLRGFSRRSEQSANDLIGLLERVSLALGVMTQQILDSGGVIGDFQGDAAMGFWGWPISHTDMVQRACLAALRIRTEFEAAARKEGHALADFRIGIGIATGRAVAGKIGTQDQVKVTVFGPVVNLASRLEGMTKIFDTPILLDETTAKLAKQQIPADRARLRRLAVVKPYGMEASVAVTELLPPEGEATLPTAAITTYESALERFEAGQWPEAFDLLHQVPARDRGKDFLTVYIAKFGRQPPPDWKGIISLGSKD